MKKLSNQKSNSLSLIESIYKISLNLQHEDDYLSLIESIYKISLNLQHEDDYISHI